MKQSKQKSMEPLHVPDNTIKMFSLKGALIFAFTCLIGTMVVPALLDLAGIGCKITTVVSTSLFGSLGICYVRNFVDSKKGVSKGLMVQFLIFFLVFFTISYYWIFYQYFI
ncbi:MAG: hypothetical protein QM657_06600 [Lacrimispora sp.]|uniref:hypothetical protein n=1 Tax=Lacrimispora sp. TaxID=2719234 RepID=UPI0039E50652